MCALFVVALFSLYQGRAAVFRNLLSVRRAKPPRWVASVPIVVRWIPAKKSPQPGGRQDLIAELRGYRRVCWDQRRRKSTAYNLVRDRQNLDGAPLASMQIFISNNLGYAAAAIIFSLFAAQPSSHQGGLIAVEPKGPL